MKILAALIGLLGAQITGILIFLFSGTFSSMWGNVIFGSFVANIFALSTIYYLHYIYKNKPGKLFINWFLGSIPVRLILFTVVMALILWLVPLHKASFILSFAFFYGIFIVVEIKFATDLKKSEG